MNNRIITKYILFILLLIVSNLSAQDIYLKYLEYPSNVYSNQVFKIKMKATIVADDYSQIETIFSNGLNVSLLNEQSQWTTDNDNEFINTFVFKASTRSFRLPTITLNLNDEYNITKFSKSIKPIKINFKNIALNDNLFSQVIAQDLNISRQITRQYNNKQLLTILKIDAINSNLNDFHINDYEEQGIDNITEDGNLKSMYYYIVVPRDTKHISFKYYNYKTQQFKLVTININLDEQLVSTQTDLNPQNSKLLYYQKIFLLLTIAIFIIIFFIFRNNLNLFILIVLILILTYLYLPNKVLLVPQNTKIYILPITNSTVFTILQHNTNVEVLKSNHKFKKIILPNQTIGWIKNEDISIH
jgi:hypothetical protein